MKRYIGVGLMLLAILPDWMHLPVPKYAQFILMVIAVCFFAFHQLDLKRSNVNPQGKLNLQRTALTNQIVGVLLVIFGVSLLGVRPLMELFNYLFALGAGNKNLPEFSSFINELKNTLPSWHQAISAFVVLVGGLILLILGFEVADRDA